VPLRTTYGRIVRRVAVLWVLGMLAQGSLLKFQIHGLQGLELYSNTLHTYNKPKKIITNKVINFKKHQK
jgi:hypothetical protein